MKQSEKKYRGGKRRGARTKAKGKKYSQVRVRYADGEEAKLKQVDFDKARKRNNKKPKRKLTEYERYLRTPAWKEKRDLALERDGRKCVRCESRARLQVHHLTYERVGAERLEDLVTLCESCHRSHHRVAA